jgi:hypothetical protein
VIVRVGVCVLVALGVILLVKLREGVDVGVLVFVGVALNDLVIVDVGV